MWVDELTGSMEYTCRGVWEDPPDATSKYAGLLLCCRLMVLNQVGRSDLLGWNI